MRGVQGSGRKSKPMEAGLLEAAFGIGNTTFVQTDTGITIMIVTDAILQVRQVDTKTKLVSPKL